MKVKEASVCKALERGGAGGDRPVTRGSPGPQVWGQLACLPDAVCCLVMLFGQGRPGTSQGVLLPFPYLLALSSLLFLTVYLPQAPG